MALMINPTPHICIHCFYSLNVFVKTKNEFIRAEYALKNLQNCRVCQEHKQVKTFPEGSKYNNVYVNLVHHYFNSYVKDIKLCGYCFKVLEDCIPFSRQCFDTSQKINRFINTFKTDPKINILKVVRMYYSSNVNISSNADARWECTTSTGSTKSTNSTCSDNTSTYDNVYGYNGSTMIDNNSTSVYNNTINVSGTYFPKSTYTRKITHAPNSTHAGHSRYDPNSTYIEDSTFTQSTSFVPNSTCNQNSTFVPRSTFNQNSTFVPNSTFNQNSTFVPNSNFIQNAVPNRSTYPENNSTYMENTSIPNYHYTDSTKTNSTFGGNSTNIGFNTGVNNTSTISGNGRQNTQIEIINKTEINIINNNPSNIIENKSNSTNNNTYEEHGLLMKLLKGKSGNYKIDKTIRTIYLTEEEIDAEVIANISKIPNDSNLTVFRKNITESIDNTCDKDKINANIVEISNDSNLEVFQEIITENNEESTTKTCDKDEINANIIEISNDSNLAVFQEDTTESHEVAPTKKCNREKTKSKKRQWTGYYYNCLLGTMKLFEFKFNNKGRPVDADWSKISKAFHIPFETLGITFDVKKGWNRLTKYCLEYLETGNIKRESHLSLLKKVIEYTGLKKPETQEKVVEVLEVMFSEEERVETPNTSEKNNNDTNDDYYKTISIDDSGTDTDTENQKPYITAVHTVKQEHKQMAPIKEKETSKLTTMTEKRKSLDLEKEKEDEVSIEELMQSEAFTTHLGLEDILRLQAKPKKPKIEYTMESDVIILD